MHTNARFAATYYDAFTKFFNGRGNPLNLSQEVVTEMRKPVVKPTDGWFDECLRTDSRFSHGFTRPIPIFNFGASDVAFGTPGAGGNLAFSDPDGEISYA